MASAIGWERDVVWPESGQKGTATQLAERMDGTPPLKRRRDKGTATWLDNRFGGPPLRFDPLPKGGRRRYTEEERGAVLDYVVEQRDVKCADECAKEIGIVASCISCWLRAECKKYRAFSELDPDEEDLRAVDCRKLLPDLRAGKTPLCIHEYTGGEKYSQGTRGQKLKVVRAREEARDGRLYFVSAGEGERRIFSGKQKKKAVDYWLAEFVGDAISNCAKAINLDVHTLTDWVNTYGSGRKRRSLRTEESSESSSEATDSDSDEDSLPDIPWEDVNKLLPIEPS